MVKNRANSSFLLFHSVFSSQYSERDLAKIPSLAREGYVWMISVEWPSSSVINSGVDKRLGARGPRVPPPQFFLGRAWLLNRYSYCFSKKKSRSFRDKSFRVPTLHKLADLVNWLQGDTRDDAQRHWTRLAMSLSSEHCPWKNQNYALFSLICFDQAL